jgi:hypothetical protein
MKYHLFELMGPRTLSLCSTSFAYLMNLLISPFYKGNFQLPMFLVGKYLVYLEYKILTHLDIGVLILFHIN